MRDLFLRHPKLAGAITWLLSATAAVFALVLADFGAPAWVFVALAVWLWTAGLPTLLATLCTLSLWGNLPAIGTPPLGAAAGTIAVVSFFAQVGTAMLVARCLKRAGTAAE